ncbi:methyl-accepting chemotaxis protein [Desulfopila inferna]|uniref:methyl-accepting chemotaxis protein n=1 Tax=Desulfopila inferna TaxID=468528 RepID=UPI00196418EE|nr:methyl-accepting chemotaxis protein [Desulfopila inferna]MBM9604340.1 methyl-accepting chemotaxis protein [Desulfopila inferna]
MLNRFKNVKFTTKLFLAMISVVIFSILITSGNAIRMSKQGLYTLGEGAMQDIHQSLYNSMAAIDSNIREKLEGDLLLLERQINSEGVLFLDEGRMIKENLINQITKDTLTKEIPKLQAGLRYLNNDKEIVDDIQEITGATATIFQLVDDKLLRISTNVRKATGERATGTYIPSDSPVFQAIMRGETYRGKAFVVNDWYLTAYKPIRNSESEIVGAIYVGQLMISAQVRKLVSETRIGSGYFFLYTDMGSLLVHPTLTESDNIFTVIPAFKEGDGMIDYIHQGQENAAYKKRIDGWGVTLAVNMNHEDIVGGLDVAMLRNNLLVGLFVIAGGILVTVFLVRSINKPLKELAEKAIKVGEGNYTINFSSRVDDAIGQLTNSLGVMVSKGKEMLEDIVRSSESLSAASTELAAISDEMVKNAESTTDIADDASANSQEVSDNMASVSAAMEESTVNLDMIATASEEMGTTIKEIAENSAKARQTTETAVTNTKKSHKSIQELGEAAKAIGSITETIREISEQTNLLALNATIEAARAGEAGKGFAVVANEIKDLAQGTAEATGKIKEAIDGIQAKTTVTVKEIEEISEVISYVDEIVNGIVTAVEEQSITTNEIVNNVNQASQGISEINENVAGSNQMTTEMSEGVAQVKERSLEVKESSQHVRSSADELSQLAERLTSLVSRFKI